MSILYLRKVRPSDSYLATARSSGLCVLFNRTYGVFRGKSGCVDSKERTNYDGYLAGPISQSSFTENTVQHSFIMSTSLSRKRKRNRCEVTAESSHSAQTLAHEHFTSDLRRMVNDDSSADVIFICKGGERVKAIRSVLVGRCDVLKKMLENGMKETSLSEISLPAISSQTLLSVFEFLYTGAISTYQPKAWRLQFETLVAAQFFLLPDLVGIVSELILEKISEVAKDMSEVAAMLTDSMTLEFSHSCHSQENKCDAIKTKLVGLLSSNWTDSKYASNLSEEALHYLLLHTKAETGTDAAAAHAGNFSEAGLHSILNDFKNEDNYKQLDHTAANNDRKIPYKQKREPSLTEYHRFRQIILWWAYQSVAGWSSQAEEMVESALPIIRDTSNIYFDVRAYAGAGDENKGTNSSLRIELDSLLASRASTESAIRLLSTIDLQYVHLLILEEVIEPLNVFSSFEIMRTFRFHARARSEAAGRVRNAMCDWKHGASLTTAGGSGYSIKNCECDIGSAIALMRMSSKSRFHLWQFEIIAERDDVSFIEVGFIFINTDQAVPGWCEKDLHKKSLWRLPDTRVLTIICGHDPAVYVINWQGESCQQLKLLYKRRYRKHSYIVFQFDCVEHNCSVTFNGEDFGICWENLPDRDFYPAVCLGNSDRPHSGLISIQTPCF